MSPKSLDYLARAKRCEGRAVGNAIICGQSIIVPMMVPPEVSAVFTPIFFAFAAWGASLTVGEINLSRRFRVLAHVYEFEHMGWLRTLSSSEYYVEAQEAA